LGKPVFQPHRSSSSGGEPADGVVGVDAIGAPAVGGDLKVLRNIAQQLVDTIESVGRQGDGAGDVPGGILGCGTDVEQHQVPSLDSLSELGAVDDGQAIAVTQIVPRQSFDVVEPFGRQVAEGEPCLQYAVGRQLVV